MRRSRLRVLLIASTAVAGMLLLGVRLGWFTDEPTYRGRTVSAWLDRLVLFENEAGVNTNGDRWVRAVPRPIQAVMNDPAYQIELAAEAVLKDSRTDPRVRRMASKVREAARSDGTEPWKSKRFLRTVEPR